MKRLKQIKPLEPFEMSGRVFIYDLNESGALRLKELIGDEIKAIRKPIPADAFNPPSLEEVIAYFKEKGYKQELAIKAYNHYKEGNWRDSNDKPVKNWRQKMFTNWMKDDYKIDPNEESGEIKMVM